MRPFIWKLIDIDALGASAHPLQHPVTKVSMVRDASNGQASIFNAQSIFTSWIWIYVARALSAIYGIFTHDF